MKYKRSSYKKISDLIALSPEYAKNRTFNSWAEVFHKSLVKVRSNSVNKPRTYEELAKRYPKKIIKILLELVCDDLMFNDVSYVLNHRRKTEKHIVIRMAAYAPDNEGRPGMRNRKSYYCHGGMKYGLRTDKVIRHHKVPYRIGFYSHNRAKVRKHLNAGKRYFNSYKEKIYSQL